MNMDATISRLAFPRYIPFVAKKAPLALWYDSQKIRFVALCPSCRELVSYATVEAACQELVLSERQGCQGCRAKKSFELNPGLVGIFLDFWCRRGAFPESPSWLEAIPPGQLFFWEKEIRAFLAADPEPIHKQDH